MVVRNTKGLADPGLTVHELSRLFFGKSSSWLRLRMREDERHPMTWMVLDGAPLVIERKDPDEAESARIFSLADIEPMAYSMYFFDLADLEQDLADQRKAQPEERARLQADQLRIISPH